MLKQYRGYIICVLLMTGALIASCQPRAPRVQNRQTQLPEAPIPYEMPKAEALEHQQVIKHLGYTVGFSTAWNIPYWVAYSLTREETNGTVKRKNSFSPDPMLKGDHVLHEDYTRSGYDRGHMAPAGDMKWSEQAMEESFYTTNICPQNRNNNAGDWKDLEELVRDLAREYGEIYICCGPIVTDASHTIGRERKIVVPQAFYKVLLRQKDDGSWTSIGFVMPNEAGNRPLMTYMHSVDEVESITNIDFFYQLPDSLEQIVEQDYTISDWTVSPSNNGANSVRAKNRT